jgi:hypothetical protein
MVRHVLLGLLLVMTGGAASGAEDTAPYNTLRAAPRFAVGHVGYAGTVSDEEAALGSLLARPDGARDLRRLVSEGTPAGRLYALWGLAVLHESDFEKLSEKYVSGVSEVETMNGCLVEREAASSIVKRIRSGAYGWPAK